MAGFEKTCPACNEKFSSLLEYTTHLGTAHKDISPQRLLELGKEKKEHIGD